MKDRWLNRRRMAWASLVAALGYPLLFLFAANGEQLALIAGPFFLFTGSVVGAYIGFATVDDKWKNAAEQTQNEPYAQAQPTGYPEVKP